MNKFQKYLSYFYKIVVEKTSSKYNEQLIVAIQDGKYVLNAKNANYSFASLHRVFRQALKKIRSNPKEILLLGCGAGSIPQIIFKEQQLSPSMDAVEIDEKVIALGKQYFHLEDYEKLNIIIDDALSFVEKCTKKYDLILIDVFNGINVPNQFISQHFLSHLKSLMKDDGEALLNFVAYNYDTKQQINDIEKTLSSIYSFTHTYRIESINRVFHFKK